MNDRNNDFDRCPSCGARIPGSANYCPVCRSALKENSGGREYQPRFNDDYRERNPGPEDDYRRQGGRHHRRRYSGKPDNYLVWAILCTTFCCVPFGIAAIAYSAQVDSLWRAGHHEEAVEVSGKAKKWCVNGAIIALAAYFFVFLLYLILGISFLDKFNM